MSGRRPRMTGRAATASALHEGRGAPRRYQAWVKPEGRIVRSVVVTPAQSTSSILTRPKSAPLRSASLRFAPLRVLNKRLDHGSNVDQAIVGGLWGVVRRHSGCSDTSAHVDR